MDFPLDIPESVPAPARVLEALGLPKIVHCVVGRKRRNMLLHIHDVEQLTKIKPDFGILLQEEKAFGNFGFIVTAAGNKDFDFLSRFFAPAAGIPEDPVTGSSHTLLAPYWSKILKKTRMKAYQASPRGGEMTVELQGDRVFLHGDALLVMKGQWLAALDAASSGNKTKS